MKYTSHNLFIDGDNMCNGFFLARVMIPEKVKYKLRVAKDGTTLTYDLNNGGVQEQFPLQLGEGEYVISLFKNVKKNNYVNEGLIKIYPVFDSEYEPYLNSNQYVNFEGNTSLVHKAFELLGKSTDETISNVMTYICKNIVYDYVRAVLSKQGQLPDIARCYDKKMGICQDIAALTVALLRIDSVPARLVIGYCGDQYHAWTEIIKNDKWTLFDPTAIIKKEKVRKKYTTERWY